MASLRCTLFRFIVYELCNLRGDYLGLAEQFRHDSLFVGGAGLLNVALGVAENMSLHLTKGNVNRALFLRRRVRGMGGRERGMGRGERGMGAGDRGMGAGDRGVGVGKIVFACHI